MKPLRPSSLLRFFTAACILTGCSKEASRPSAPTEPVLSRQYRQGSVTVIFSVSETNISTSGKIQLTLAAHTPPDSTVVFPEIESVVEPFAIASSYSEPLQRLPNGKQLHRRIWELVPALPGETLFGPLELQANTKTITTEPFSITVTSLLPPEVSTLEIKDIAEPIALLPRQREKRNGLLKILLGLMGIALVFSVFRHRRKEPEIVVLPPHETARLALENLPEDELAKIHALIDILVVFIGKRFRLPVLGRTLEEILPLLPTEGLANHRQSLEEFLVAAEQIRFSHKVPSGFSDDLETYVRAFVEDMKEEPCD